MKELINCFKLCKYSYQIKTNIIFLILFMSIGILNEVASQGTSYLGGFYIVMCGIYIFQFVMSLCMSDMIMSSWLGRRVQLDIPVKLNSIVSLILYTILGLFRLYLTGRYPEKANEIAASLLAINIMFFFIFIYAAVVYKYFIVSIVVFCFTITFAITGFNILNNIEVLSNITIGQAVASGYIIIVVGTILQYLICRLLIKKPITQRAFRGIFKNAK